MTREEAANILDPETTLEAYSKISYYGGFEGENVWQDAVNEACRMGAAEGGTMMKRYYAVTMPNGDIYGIPAHVIADNYANYYATKGEDYQENYDAMLHWFDTNDYEFADWAKNNMDWDDVRKHAILLISLESQTKSCDFQDGWVNGDYEYKFMGEPHAE